jgi:hypothetical protein
MYIYVYVLYVYIIYIYIYICVDGPGRAKVGWLVGHVGASAKHTRAPGVFNGDTECQSAQHSAYKTDGCICVVGCSIDIGRTGMALCV